MMSILMFCVLSFNPQTNYIPQHVWALPRAQAVIYRGQDRFPRRGRRK